MSATVVSDTKLVSKQPSHEPPQIEIAKCECCGLTEEYTAAYIDDIRKHYAGIWICGLCSEAVEYEILRKGRLGISAEEALAVHMRFCGEFRSATAEPAADFISVFKHILKRRSLDSPRAVRSAPGSPVSGGGAVCTTVLGRTGSCLPTLSGGV